MIVDYFSNGFLLVADAALLYALWKRRRLPVFWGLLAIASVLGLLFAAVVGRGMFGAFRVLSWILFVHLPTVLAGSAFLLW